MKLNRFSIISMLLTCVVSMAKACGPEGAFHNYYLFSVLEPSQTWWGQTKSNKENEIDLFWKKYTNGKVPGYLNNEQTILKIAQQKNDNQIITYMKWLNHYLRISYELSETWEYPTEQQLQQRQHTLVNMLNTAKEYKGTRLRNHYALLVMRANLLLNRDKDNITYWTQTAQHLPVSQYRDIMENIYAHALMSTGKETDAVEIYARQGDYLSINWIARNYRNLAGIKAIAQRKPNSMVMPYLVEGYMHTVQDAFDDYGYAIVGNQDYDYDYNLDDPAERAKAHAMAVRHATDTLQLQKQEMNDFIAFARQMIDDHKTETPCLWMTAIAHIHFMMGNYAEARKELQQAINMNGTPKMKANARVILLANSIHCEDLNAKYLSYFQNEMKWIQQQNEAGKVFDKQLNLYTNNEEYYTHSLDRIIFQELGNRYLHEGNLFMEMATKAYYDSLCDTTSDECNYCNEDEFDERLRKLPADSIVMFYSFLGKKHANPFEDYIIRNIKYTESYFYHIIATRLIGNGRFAEALPYLRKYPEDNKESLKLADFREPRWFRYQPDYNDYTNLNLRKNLKSNTQLDFCEEMIDMKSRHDLASEDTIRQALAYQMAVRLYQASYAGNCSWISQIDRYSPYYDAEFMSRATRQEKVEWRYLNGDDIDFIDKALEFLNESKMSKNNNLEFASLYAIGFVDPDKFIYSVGEDIVNNYDEFANQHAQYQHLMDLHRFLKANPRYEKNRHVRHCDYLQLFRQGLRG